MDVLPHETGSGVYCKECQKGFSNKASYKHHVNPTFHKEWSSRIQHHLVLYLMNLILITAAVFVKRSMQIYISTAGTSKTLINCS